MTRREFFAAPLCLFMPPPANGRTIRQTIHVGGDVSSVDIPAIIEAVKEGMITYAGERDRAFARVRNAANSAWIAE